MDWDRGLKQLAYWALGLVWVVALLVAAADGGPALSRMVVYLLVVTVGFVAIYAAIRWALRDFVVDKR